MSVLGLHVIPHRRRAAKKDFHDKICEMRIQIQHVLSAEWERQADETLCKLNEAIAPCSRYLQAKRDDLMGKRDELLRVQKGILLLRDGLDPVVQEDSPLKAAGVLQPA